MTFISFSWAWLALHDCLFILARTKSILTAFEATDLADLQVTNGVQCLFMALVAEDTVQVSKSF